MYLNHFLVKHHVWLAPQHPRSRMIILFYFYKVNDNGLWPLTTREAASPLTSSWGSSLFWIVDKTLILNSSKWYLISPPKGWLYLGLLTAAYLPGLYTSPWIYSITLILECVSRNTATCPSNCSSTCQFEEGRVYRLHQKFGVQSKWNCIWFWHTRLQVLVPRSFRWFPLT